MQVILLSLISILFALIATTDAFSIVTPLDAIRSRRGHAAPSQRCAGHSPSEPSMHLITSTRLNMLNQTDSGAVSESTDDDNRGLNPISAFGAAADALFTAPFLAPILAWGPLVSNSSFRAKVADLMSSIQDTVNPAVVVGTIGIGMSVVAYNRRAEEVGDAAEIKWQALGRLREARARQLSSSTSDVSSEVGGVEKAARDYESALRRELELRSFLPGIRVTKVPNDPLESESEDAAAVRQFLGLKLTEEGRLEKI